MFLKSRNQIRQMKEIILNCLSFNSKAKDSFSSYEWADPAGPRLSQFGPKNTIKHMVECVLFSSFVCTYHTLVSPTWWFQAK